MAINVPFRNLLELCKILIMSILIFFILYIFLVIYVSRGLIMYYMFGTNNDYDNYE